MYIVVLVAADVSAFGRLRNVGWLNTQCDKLWQAELQTESSKHEKTTFIWICWRRSLDRPWQNSITKWSRCNKNFLWQREVISAFPGRLINYNINIMLCCVIDLMMKWIWWLLKCIFDQHFWKQNNFEDWSSVFWNKVKPFTFLFYTNNRSNLAPNLCQIRAK